eukprot:1730473-Alexandrium_andersonii.AAC.1
MSRQQVHSRAHHDAHDRKTAPKRAPSMCVPSRMHARTAYRMHQHLEPMCAHAYTYAHVHGEVAHPRAQTLAER